MMEEFDDPPRPPGGILSTAVYGICIIFSAFMLFHLGKWSVRAEIADAQVEVRAAHALVAESSRICQLVQLHNAGRR